MAHPQGYSDADPYLADLRRIFKPDPDERPALVADERSFSPRYFGPGGWLALECTAADVDWDEVWELCDASSARWLSSA